MNRIFQVRRLAWMLALATVVNVILLGGYLSLRNAADVYNPRYAFPEIVGIRLDGTRMPARSAQCYVIRITADACPYCKKDQPNYSQIVRTARDVGCHVVAVAPRAGGMAPIPDQQDGQLKFVPMNLGEVLSPFLTPQTIVLDEARRVVFQRQGAFDDPALREALAVIRRFASS